MSHDLLLQMAYWRSLASWQLSYALAFFARVCITALGLSRAISSAPLGQQFTVAIYACVFTCACSFTVCSVQGLPSVLISFSVFSTLPSHPLLLLAVVLLSLFLH